MISSPLAPAGFSRIHHLVFAVTFLFAVDRASAQPAAANDSATIALWLFDDPVDSTTAIDSSGNGYHLSLGPDSAIAPDGKYGSALNANATDADGLGAHRNKAEAALNPGDSSWTLECWIKAKPSMRGDNRIWGLSGTNYIDYGRGENLASLYIANQFMPVEKWGWPTRNLKDDGEYHHVAFVYDSPAKTLSHFFDGKLQHSAKCSWSAVDRGDASNDAVFPPHFPQLQIGMRDPIQQWDDRELSGQKRSMKKFDGYIDEMRFSGKAIYIGDFDPPGSLAKLAVPARPETTRVTTANPESAAAIRDIGDRKQLFIDDRFIERGEGIRLQMNQPEKIPLLFEPMKDSPLYPSNIIYLEDRKTYRMYYGAFSQSRLCCAESSDGIRWVSPAKDNGIFYGKSAADASTKMGFAATVMLDPRDVPERRFKAFEDRRIQGNHDDSGVYAFYSSDGIRFTEAGRVLPFLTEGAVSAWWDTRINKYVVFMRAMNTTTGLRMVQGNQFFYDVSGVSKPVGPDTMVKKAHENIRSVGRIETDDLLKPWPYNKDAPRTHYTTAQHVPMVLAADARDGFTDFYNNAAVIYPFAQDVYLMFPSAFRHFHPSRQPHFYRFEDANGPIEIQLAVSRDGVNWKREHRTAYIPTGMTDEPDRWLQMLGTGMVRSGNYLLQYYWSSSRLHDSLYLRPELARDWTSSLFAVRQRLDGFISADADHLGGSITTPPLKFNGRRLTLNHNSNATGTIFVEIRDLSGQPIPGYALTDCEEITGNDVAWEVRWRGNADVRPLIGKAIKLHFKMRSAKLYGFQFAGEKG